MTTAPMWLTGDEAADTLLTEDDNALLIGMVLDQQVPMEKAFTGPLVIAQRMGGSLDVGAIAATSEEDFVALCSDGRPFTGFPGRWPNGSGRSARCSRSSTTARPRTSGRTPRPAPS